jgi:hypothetical protein
MNEVKRQDKRGGMGDRSEGGLIRLPPRGLGLNRTPPGLYERVYSPARPVPRNPASGGSPAAGRTPTLDGRPADGE